MTYKPKTLTFKELRPVNADIAAEKLGISRRSIFRYDKAPSKLANLAASQLAGYIHSKYWLGWKISGENIIDPFGNSWTHEYILAMTFQHQLLRELKNQVKILRAENKKLKSQPVAAANDAIYRIVTG